MAVVSQERPRGGINSFRSYLVRRAGPSEGWLVFLLAMVAVLTLPMTASMNGLMVGLEPTVLLSAIALTVSWWIGRTRRTGATAVVFIGAIGMLAVLSMGVHVLSVTPVVRQAGAWFSWWLRPERLPDQTLLQALVAPRADSAPAITYFADQASALGDFARRIGWWTEGLLAGAGGTTDNLVLVALVGLILWAAAGWAGWWLARRGRPFLALVPTGLLLAQQVYAADEGHVQLLTFLGTSTALLVLANYDIQSRRWEATGTDFSSEIRLDALLTAIVLAGACVLISPTIPFITSGELSRKFWEVFEEPYRGIEDRWSSSFRGAQPGRSLVPVSGVAEGGLPRSHLLGGSPDLGREIALRIQTRGAREGEALYWRGQTFAYYDGHGWSEPSGVVSELELAAGEPWAQSQRLVERRTILSRVEVAAASRAVLYGAGEPISVDRPYVARVRLPGELVALRVQGGPRRYNVLGGVLDQDPDILRSAGTTYPSEEAFAQAYLQLPADLPSELRAYAEKLTAGAETPYDRALAIETALREIPYTLDLPSPPRDRELVSWFLFDLQEGYCDYTASAMVVLSRLAGIPARLAVGYATGSYEREEGEYVVSELSAHSWPELYFPSVGWVAFEPTAGRAAPQRVSTGAGIPPWMRMPDAMNLDTGLLALADVSQVERRLDTFLLSLRAMLAALNAAAAMLVVFGWARRQPSALPESLPGMYERLINSGRHLGAKAVRSNTPREQARHISLAAAAVADQTVMFRDRAAEDARLVSREARQLAASYERATYAPESAEQLVIHYAEGRDWSPLWSALRRLRLGRLGRR